MEAKKQQAILALYDAGTTGVLGIVRKLDTTPLEVISVLQDSHRVTRVLSDLTDEELGSVLMQGCERAFKYPDGWMVYNCRAYPLKDGKCYVCMAREEIDRRVAVRNSEGGPIEATELKRRRVIKDA